MTVITYTGTSMSNPFKRMYYYINEHIYSDPESINFIDVDSALNLII
jgi:chromatin remodeling complex protein RSC6